MLSKISIPRGLSSKLLAHSASRANSSGHTPPGRVSGNCCDKEPQSGALKQHKFSLSSRGRKSKIQVSTGPHPSEATREETVLLPAAGGSRCHLVCGGFTPNPSLCPRGLLPVCLSSKETSRVRLGAPSSPVTSFQLIPPVTAHFQRRSHSEALGSGLRHTTLGSHN